MKRILKKYKAIIAYLFFGVLTTLINIVTYYLCYNIAFMPNVISTIVAWVLAVAFAFITNKIWVFNSKSFNYATITHEIWTFLGARLATGMLDIVIMYLTVDVFLMDSTIWKLLSNIIVIILNYIFSKLIIFKNKNTGL